MEYCKTKNENGCCKGLKKIGIKKEKNRRFSILRIRENLNERENF